MDFRQMPVCTLRNRCDTSVAISFDCSTLESSTPDELIRSLSLVVPPLENATLHKLIRSLSPIVPPLENATLHELIRSLSLVVPPLENSPHSKGNIWKVTCTLMCIEKRWFGVESQTRVFDQAIRSTWCYTDLKAARPTNWSDCSPIKEISDMSGKVACGGNRCERESDITRFTGHQRHNFYRNVSGRTEKRP